MKKAFIPLLAVVGAMFVAVPFLIERAPYESTMGLVQKIFYFHVPSAYSMYLGAAACFVGSVGYLVKPTDLFDGLGRAGAEIGCEFIRRRQWPPDEAEGEVHR